MSPERWAEVERLYHEALGRDVDHRAAFLRDVCANDEELRREVEGLLAQPASGDFMAAPAIAVAADLESMAGAPLLTGRRIGVYQIQALLGAGGMGEVYRARDPRLGRDVAIKVLLATTANDDERSRRLHREARAAAALNHPNICTIHEVCEADGFTFIAMEYVEGVSIRDRLRDGPLPVQEAIASGIQAADALAYAHDRGVIHRDFKSGNVIVTSGARLKVIDFGLARHIDPDAPTMTTMVPAGTMAGTPHAMAPEQVRGEVADARSDLWAVGVLLYEMVSGTAPFAGATVSELFSAILRDAPKPLPASTPAALTAIIDRCLAKDSSARFASASDLRTALEAAQSDLAPRRAHRAVTLSRRAWLTAAVTTAIGAVAVIGYESAATRARLSGGGVEPTSIRLAVLPFDNLTGDPAQDYFSDGLTEELIGRLGELDPRRLSVISRSSSMRYRRNQTSLSQVAHDLNVDYVLEGSARREGTRVRVTAALVRVNDQTERWAQIFDRELASVLTVQSDIARGVASSLALTLLPGVQTRLARTPSINADAFDAYLKGLAHAEKLTREDLDLAEQYFDQSLAKQPDYALAYVGLSAVWSGRQQMQFVAPRVASPRLREAAQRAVALDPMLPEAHYRLAIQYAWTDWDWSAAEEAFHRSIDLAPSFAEAHSGYAHFLYMMKRPVEGAQQIRRAVDLDPFNEQVRAFYAVTLHFEHRFAEEEPELHKVLLTDPRSPMATAGLPEMLYFAGRYAESLTSERARWTAQGDTEMEDALTRGYLQGGYREAMRRAADTLATRTDPTGAGNIGVARLYARAGVRDRALDWLENAYRAHDPNMPYIGVAPIWDELRGESRFKDLMARMKLPA